MSSTRIIPLFAFFLMWLIRILHYALQGKVMSRKTPGRVYQFTPGGVVIVIYVKVEKTVINLK